MENLPFLTHEAKFKDSGIHRASELLKKWKNKPVEDLGLIGVPLSKPSISHSGASFAPESIRKMMNSFTTYSIQQDIDLITNSITDFGNILMHVTNIEESHSRIESSVKTILQSNPAMTPIFLGGDHSITAPIVKAFQQIKGKVGIIQFDAHHDLRNLEDGGPSNGTPFRQLIEHGAIQGKYLYQIGIRDFSNGKVYSDYAKENGVTVYTMSDVFQRGMTAILKESIAMLQKEVETIYVSLDMDVMDQAYAPGCPAIGPGGLNSQMLIEAISLLSREPSVCGMDIVEIDPTLDFRDITSRLAAYSVLTFLMGFGMRI